MRERLVRLKERFSQVMNEYGPVALGVHFGLFGLVLLGFALAFRLGFKLEKGGDAGLLVAAYGAARLTWPLRALAVLALTPPIGRWLKARKVAKSI